MITNNTDMDYSKKDIEELTDFAKRVARISPPYSSEYISENENFKVEMVTIHPRGSNWGSPPLKVHNKTGLMRADSEQFKELSETMRVFVILWGAFKFIEPTRSGESYVNADNRAWELLMEIDPKVNTGLLKMEFVYSLCRNIGWSVNRSRINNVMSLPNKN